MIIVPGFSGPAIDAATLPIAVSGTARMTTSAPSRASSAETQAKPKPVFRCSWAAGLRSTCRTSKDAGLRLLASRYPIFPPAPNSAIFVGIENAPQPELNFRLVRQSSNYTIDPGESGWRPLRFITLSVEDALRPSHGNGGPAIIHTIDISKGQAADF